MNVNDTSRLVVPGNPAAVAPARRITATLRWGIRLTDDLAGTVALVASELLTNAVVHTEGPSPSASATGPATY